MRRKEICYEVHSCAQMKRYLIKILISFDMPITQLKVQLKRKLKG